MWFMCVQVVLGSKHRACVWVRRGESGRKYQLYINARGEQEYNEGVGSKRRTFPTLHSETNHDLVHSWTL